MGELVKLVPLFGFPLILCMYFAENDESKPKNK